MKISIEENMNRWKARICDYLNQSSKKWSKKKLMVYWFFFVLVGVATSLEISVHAVQYSKPVEVISRPKTIEPHRRSALPDFNREWFSALLSKLKAYQAYLDSLSLVDTTKYQAILKSQPFLLDSLQVLETLLVKNIKK